MSSLKTTVSIEGELVDLAEVFKALAAAAAATPRPEPRISGEAHIPFNTGVSGFGISGSTVLYDPEKQTLGGQPVSVSRESLGYNPSELTSTKEFLKAEGPEARAAFNDSGRAAVLSSFEGSTDEPETQEQSGKRKRRTKAEIEADRLAAEQPIKGNDELMRSHTEALEKATAAANAIENWNLGQPKDDVAAADEAVNAFEAGITTVRESEDEVDTDEVIAADVPATENKTPTVTEQNTTAPAPQPNTTSATVDGTSPFIAELRAFCQRKVLGKPENQVLIKNLLTEFGAAGLSALKEVDKMAFKQRLEALPFK